MNKLTKDEFIDKCSELVEEHFPKGKTNMRGEALVLVAQIAQYLIEQDLVEYEGEEPKSEELAS